MDSPGLGHGWAVPGTTTGGRSSRLGGGCKSLSLGFPGRGRGVRLVRNVHGGITSSSGLAFSGWSRASGGDRGRRTRGGRRGVCGKSRGGASDSGGHEKLILPKMARTKKRGDEKSGRRKETMGVQPDSCYPTRTDSRAEGELAQPPSLAAGNTGGTPGGN